MAWTTIELEVTTPLFNGGGVTRRGETGLRVPSLRGALRTWFRALAGSVAGNDIAGLARLEARVFGSTDARSPVALRIADPPTATSDKSPKWATRHAIYLLGQQHGSLKDEEITAPFVAPGTTVALKLRFGHDAPAAALVLASLWLLCTYGGLGARTRRGFGGLRITNVVGDVPQPWTPESLRSPGLDFYRQLWRDERIDACRPLLEQVARRDPPIVFDPNLAVGEHRPPHYPVLSPDTAQAGLSGSYTSWAEVLKHAGQHLRRFRIDRTTGPGKLPRKPTPEWKEVVTGDGDHFTVGALGLPVVYAKTASHGNGLSVQATSGDDLLRRASPLWLRPVGRGREWRLLSLAFHSRFLPDDVRVHVCRERNSRTQHIKPVNVTTADVKELTQEWLKALSAETFPR